MCLQMQMQMWLAEMSSLSRQRADRDLTARIPAPAGDRLYHDIINDTLLQELRKFFERKRKTQSGLEIHRVPRDAFENIEISIIGVDPSSELYHGAKKLRSTVLTFRDHYIFQ